MGKELSLGGAYVSLEGGFKGVGRSLMPVSQFVPRYWRAVCGPDPDDK
jgi:hypothetical protein